MSEEVAKIKAQKLPVYSGVIAYFPRAIAEIARLSQSGAVKHGHDCEREGIINENYTVRMWDDAAGRHQLEYAKGNTHDEEMNSLHRTNEVWCKLAALEKILQEEEELEIQLIHKCNCEFNIGSCLC